MFIKLIRNKRGKLLLLSVIIAASVIFTIFSDSTTHFASDALRLCAVSVIPSLFPFMVLSSIASKLASSVSDTDSKKISVFLSVVLGTLCGFPVGAATVASAYKNNALCKSEAEELCALCNNTGPAFVIGIIGGTFWRNYNIGIMFYVCQIISAVIVHISCKLIFGKKINPKPQTLCISRKDNKHSPHTSSPSNVFADFSGKFCSSVGESAINVIQICGYIVFFKVVCDMLKLIIPQSKWSLLIYSITASILEFTTGSASAAELGGTLGIALCGFTVGFSGLSVMAQSANILTKAGLSSGSLFKRKIAVGLVCSTLCSITYRLLPEVSSTVITSVCYDVSEIRYISSVIVLCSMIFYIIRLLRHPLR